MLGVPEVTLCNEYALKRSIDCLLAFTGILISLPISIIISFLIYLEDRGPVFYYQQRVGRGGELFTAPKFRTMIVDSDKIYGPVQARVDDPRITRIGKILRATALDEIPQLWCILMGKMSFVGPRALLIAEIETFCDDGIIPARDIPGYEKRVSVRPGLTGIAQIFAPRDIKRRNKFRYDRLYINNMSLAFDLKLIVLSFLITFTGKWENRGNKF